MDLISPQMAPMQNIYVANGGTLHDVRGIVQHAVL